MAKWKEFPSLPSPEAIADAIWEAHKHWDGERKYALRQIVKWLKNTPGGEAEGEFHPRADGLGEDNN